MPTIDKYIMSCGCASNALRIVGDERIPACVIHDDAVVVKKVESPTDGLEGRQAKCTYNNKYGKCTSITESSWLLPFFKHRPDKEYDEYYCGCYGWD